MHRFLTSFFTRIFLSFWAVIVLIAASAAAVTAIDFAAAPDRPSTVVRAASEALNRDGVAGLRVWLAERNRSRPGQRTLIIDSTGKDILGQKLPEFRRMRFRGGEPPRMPGGAGPGERPEGGGPGDGPRFGASIIRSPDGAVFRVIFDPPPRRGPFSPPFSWGVRGALLAVALGVSGLVSYLLARSISTPVRRLQAATHTLSAGNLDARAGEAVTKRKDELGALGREFDSMAERLGALIAARQSLLRDISHELRSPLARMEMAIGLARQDPASTGAQLDRVQRESERLDRLIGHILEYARLERDPATFRLEELDLAELVRQILHDAEFESQSPPGRLLLTSDDTVMIRGEPNVLHSAIDNVVRNALRHGDTRLPIEVALAQDADAVRITVRDHGPGVLEADLPRIFEPFYRAGTVDAKHVSIEGTGIGLAITQRAAALHGGNVIARNAEGGGLLVTIVIPRTTSEGAGA